jgi:hypothetical protein
MLLLMKNSSGGEKMFSMLFYKKTILGSVANPERVSRCVRVNTMFISGIVHAPAHYVSEVIGGAVGAAIKPLIVEWLSGKPKVYVFKVYLDEDGSVSVKYKECPFIRVPKKCS